MEELLPQLEPSKTSMSHLYQMYTSLSHKSEKNSQKCFDEQECLW